ncbi:hypothetical protein AXX17_AT5G44760 [Arabidopsis thaliana]|uniref:Uncharacterized protein n=1 Tax=Arabidopsis thaliana TaxID=3702 RepID=A0A178ULX6_ARATH|nr:hypothetical protein AXX17_AT5G44760 [Arabidopsis thaliana]
MASTKADQFLELVAELDRVNTSTNVDKDQVKDMIKRIDIDNMLNPASSSQKISRSMDRKNW